MKKPLWSPSEELIKQANITRFVGFVNKRYGLKISKYNDLYRWSIEKIPEFWAAMWDFAGLKASQYDSVVDDLKKFPGARWFPGARLNFAENLLKFRDDSPAITWRDETGNMETMTGLELYRSVARLAHALRNAGVLPGDRVAAYMPNVPGTVVAMLAATSLGAIWSSCGTEIGPTAVLSRFGQIEPRILFAADGYVYKGESHDILSSVREIAESIPSLKKVIIYANLREKPDISHIPNAVYYGDLVAEDIREIRFEDLPFDHPAYIMFSSGTTGKPKCMVQGGGGVLLNHLKELILHTDLKRTDNITYITSPSWMMWNWLISTLAVGARITLYDGSPVHPDWSTIWRMIEDEGVTVFGCSASYINYLRGVGARPKNYGLGRLREISQTGSPLSSEGFEYVYGEIKRDLHFNSISGGTDINGCFAIGTPIQPVYAGELQGPALGMKVRAYDDKGNSITDREGELVCEAPSPSMPLYFWNDPDGTKYRAAYFSHYPGVWRHGDWIVMHGDTGGITFLGRSDFTLKPSGVRIGSAEIYDIVERFAEVADSIVSGQALSGEERIILFVKLTKGYLLTDDLINRIKKALRDEAYPRHVPALIIATPDIPYTFSMKKVESAVANIIHNRPITNRDSIINPECLDFYEAFAKSSKNK
jgi:acetoacetyl-CoA synthetase